MDYTISKTTAHEERVNRFRLAGNGAAAPTVEIGQRVTVTRTGVGVYRIAWTVSPGTFVSLADGIFGGTVAADTKGCTMTHARYDAANRQIDISIWSSAFAARDLLTTELLSFAVIFAETSAV